MEKHLWGLQQMRELTDENLDFCSVFLSVGLVAEQVELCKFPCYIDVAVAYKEP